MNPFRRNIISIYRFPEQTAIDSDVYESLDLSLATIIVANLGADIQQSSSLKAPTADLPGDVSKGSSWMIFFNYGQNLIKDRDIIVDEQNIRYQITNAYWTVFQYQCPCERLQS